MSSKGESPIIFYYPCCPINNCKGVLRIKYINENSSIDYECEKNKDRKGYNIYFETFNRYYLKQKEINKCIKCNSLNITNKCKICEQYYCSKCSINEEHIKQNEYNYFVINNNICELHKCKNHYYCINCNKYLCDACSEDEKHKGHNINYIIDLVPSKNKIDEIINRLKYYDDLIKKIDLWNKEFLEKIKRNIINEKNLMSKLILNYNQNLMNYTYHLNFEESYNYTKSFNNEYLEEFYLSDSFQEKTKLIMNYICSTKPVQKTDYFFTSIKASFQAPLKQLNDDYFINYNNSNTKIQLIKYDEKNISKIYQLKNIQIKYTKYMHV